MSPLDAEKYDLGEGLQGLLLLQIGYLTWHSTLLPRWLGPIVALGVGWLAFLYPPLARALWPYIILASVGELLLVLWPLVKGVDEQRWHEQAASAGLSG